MVVELKRSKITVGVLKQTFIANIRNIDQYEVLGWCLLGSERWNLLYNPETKDLKKFRHVLDACRTINRGEDKPHGVKVTVVGPSCRPAELMYEANSEYDALKTLENIKNITERSKDKGQFYL